MEFLIATAVQSDRAILCRRFFKAVALASFVDDRGAMQETIEGDRGHEQSRRRRCRPHSTKDSQNRDSRLRITGN
jgi:3'-phosphoadenosine 5'-phosphosulfate sulfotransferase (PAPS reductase)/FAD synthetase